MLLQPSGVILNISLVQLYDGFGIGNVGLITCVDMTNIIYIFRVGVTNCHSQIDLHVVVVLFCHDLALAAL